MRVSPVAVIALIVAACGGSSTAPTPLAATPPVSAPTTPTPSLITIQVTVTDTITGATVGPFMQTATSLPVRVAVSAPGYFTRETVVRTTTPTVDLFPERGFDLAFYRQLVRDDFQKNRGFIEPSWVLEQAPSFYLEVEGAKGVSAEVGARLEAVARQTVPALTGGKFQVTRWETGPTPRAPQAGWIVIERADLGPDICGQATIGAVAGHIWLHSDNVCNLSGVFAHEIGHALGFFHVNSPSALMYPQARRSNISDAPIERERDHAAFAYKRPRGSRDIDVDPQTSGLLTTSIIID
jgi:hypothetical protein